ncbi:MAG: bacterial proteasome activator family protein [Acidimicrobiales bacterium]
MSDTPQENQPEPLIIVTSPSSDAGAPQAADRRANGESVERPAKVMRIGSMIKQLLDEVEKAPLDAASRSRLKEIYERSVAELADGLSPELVDELDRLALPFESEEPSEAELRIAQAQLVGWLEGLFHGIQAALFAQQLSAQSQLEEMRRRSLPAASSDEQPQSDRPGPYL